MDCPVELSTVPKASCEPVSFNVRGDQEQQNTELAVAKNYRQLRQSGSDCDVAKAKYTTMANISCNLYTFTGDNMSKYIQKIQPRRKFSYYLMT